MKIYLKLAMFIWKEIVFSLQKSIFYLEWKKSSFFGKLLYAYTLNNYNEIVAQFSFPYYLGNAID